MSLLASREVVHAWELRTAWATQREVVLRLDVERASLERVQGLVTRVAASGAYAHVADASGVTHVPVDVVLAISYPHFHEVGADQLLMFAPPVREAPIPGQLSLLRQLARAGRGRRWHLPHPADPAVSACGRAELTGEARDATEVEERRRCSSPGCRGMWPQ